MEQREDQINLERGKRLEEAIEYLQGVGHISTQVDFAKKVGCTTSQISNAKRGIKKNVTEPFFRKVCIAFPVLSYKYLVSGEGELLDVNYKTEPTLVMPNEENPPIPYIYYKERIEELKADHKEQMLKLESKIKQLEDENKKEKEEKDHYKLLYMVLQSKIDGRDILEKGKTDVG